MPRNVKFKFSGFSGVINGLVELFLDHFDLLVALTKPMQLMKNGEEGNDFSIVNARILQKTNVAERRSSAYINSVFLESSVLVFPKEIFLVNLK